MVFSDRETSEHSLAQMAVQLGYKLVTLLQQHYRGRITISLRSNPKGIVKEHTKSVAIVDPYSSGALLAAEFKRRSIPCLMVQSGTEIPAMYRSSSHPENFTAVIFHRGAIEETAAQLRQWQAGWVLGGCELGVGLADQLSEHLSLPSNGTKLSATRRNKYLMGERVRQCGLRTPRQCSSARLDDLLEWIVAGDVWPAIVKPLDSSGSDGVRLCASEREVAEAFDEIVGQKNKLNIVNGAALVQEYLEGEEYVVDTVSYNGRHKAAAFWKYGKSRANASFAGLDIELLSASGERQRQLFAYAAAILDALGIQYGPAHCELMWVEGEPVLVEIGARLNGGDNPLICRACSGYCQVDMTVEAYLDPDRFLANLDSAHGLPRRGMRVFLRPNGDGKLKGLPRQAEIEALSSFHQMHIGAQRDLPVPPIAGWVVLIHADKKVLEEDCQRIRQLESNGLFEID